MVPAGLGQPLDAKAEPHWLQEIGPGGPSYLEAILWDSVGPHRIGFQ